MATQPAESRVVLTPEQREQLESIAKSRSLPAGLVARARIILMSAEATKVQIAQTLGISRTTVAKWQHRFYEGGVTGLYDELRPGRPRSVSDERVARLVKRTLETKPSNGTHWNVRQIAAESKLTKSTVHRIWQAFGLQLRPGSGTDSAAASHGGWLCGRRDPRLPPAWDHHAFRGAEH